MITADLSIDFRFFVRDPRGVRPGQEEIPAVPEHLQEDSWDQRLMTPEMIGQYDPATHADFLPQHTWGVLQRHCGVNVKGLRGFRVADSHACALEHLAKDKRGPDLLINLDVSHDAWDRDLPITSRNWLAHYADRFPNTAIITLFPKWVWEAGVSAEGCVVPRMELRSFLGTDLAARGLKLRDVMAARSGTWVPPSLDPLFKDLAAPFGKMAMSHGFCGDLPGRYWEAPEEPAPGPGLPEEPAGEKSGPTGF